MYGDYPPLSQIKKILVIKLRHLGDVLLTTPVFQVLKKELPEAEIDAYIYKSAYPMLEGHSAISEILLYDREIKKLSFFSRMKEELKILKKIRSKKYDLVLNLTEGDRGALAAKISKAPFKIGYKTNSGLFGKNKFYSHFVKNSSSRHMVEQNLDFVRKLGIVPKIEDRDLFFHIPQDAYLNISMMLKEHAVDEKNFVLIHPASRWRYKCWPVFRMKNLTRMLIEKKYQVVFTAGDEPFEKAMVKEIIESFPKNSVLNLAGKISLKELGALIDMCKVLLCVDSVPLHIASALKAKCVCLFGPTVDKTWGPWNNKSAKIISENFSCRPCCLDGCGGSKISDCLYSIKEEKVFQALEEVLL